MADDREDVVQAGDGDGDLVQAGVGDLVQAGGVVQVGGMDLLGRDMIFSLATWLSLNGLVRFGQANMFTRVVCRGEDSRSLLNKATDSFILLSKDYPSLGLSNIFLLQEDEGTLVPFWRNCQLHDFEEGSVVGVVGSYVALLDRSKWRFAILDFSSSLVVMDYLPPAPSGVTRISVGFGCLNGDHLLYVQLFGPVLSSFTFSLSERAWKVVSVFPPTDIAGDPRYILISHIGLRIRFRKNFLELPGTPAQFYNGSLYWPCSARHDYIIRYDLSTDRYTPMQFRGSRIIRLGILHGSLAVCRILDADEDGIFRSASLQLHIGRTTEDHILTFKCLSFESESHLKPLFFAADGTLVCLQDNKKLIGLNVYNRTEVLYGALGLSPIIDGFFCIGRVSTLPTALGRFKFQ